MFINQCVYVKKGGGRGGGGGLGKGVVERKVSLRRLSTLVSLLLFKDCFSYFVT